MCRKNYSEIYCNGLFCALGRFVPWVVLCRGSFCVVGRWSLGCFVPWAVLCVCRFVMGNFYLGPFRDGLFCMCTGQDTSRWPAGED